MHILPRVLALLLLAAPALADERLDPYVGDWAGTVTVSPNGCAWKVRLSLKPREGSLRGTFFYSGPCSKKPGSGHFNADAGEGDCLHGTLAVPGLPAFNGEACFDQEGALVFRAGPASARLSVSDGGTEAELQASSPLGSADGEFVKVERKARKPGARGKTNGKKGKTARKAAAPPPEVLIGGY